MHFSNDNFADVGHTLGLIFAQSFLGLVKEAAVSPMFSAGNEARFRALMDRPIDPGPRQVATRRISAFGSEADSALAAQQSQRAGGPAASATPTQPRARRAPERTVSAPTVPASSRVFGREARPMNSEGSSPVTPAPRRGATVPLPIPNTNGGPRASAAPGVFRSQAPNQSQPPVNFTPNPAMSRGMSRATPADFTRSGGYTPSGGGMSSRPPADGTNSTFGQSKSPVMASRSPAASMPTNMSQFFGGGNKPTKPATTSQAPNMSSNPTKSYIRG